MPLQIQLLYQQKSIQKEFYFLYIHIHVTKPGYHSWYGDADTGWIAEEPGFDFQKVQEFFFPLMHPDQLWGPLSILFSGYCRLFPCSVQLATYLQALLSLRINGAIPSCPTCSLDCLSTTLPYLYTCHWYWTTNGWNCTVLVMYSSTVLICNCPRGNRTAITVISLQVTCKPAPTPTPTPSNMVFLFW